MTANATSCRVGHTTYKIEYKGVVIYGIGVGGLSVQRMVHLHCTYIYFYEVDWDVKMVISVRASGTLSPTYLGHESDGSAINASFP